ERFEQPVEILMRMERGDGQNVLLPRRADPSAAFADAEKLRVDAMMNDHDLAPCPRVITRQIICSGLGDGDENSRPPRRKPEHQIPEREIKPAEELRMPLMLQIVKNRYRP